MKEVTSRYPRPELQPQPQPQPQTATATVATAATATRATATTASKPRAPSCLRRLSSYCNPQASLEVKAVRQEGTDAGEGSRETASTPAVSACSSFRRKVAKYRNGRASQACCWNLAAGLASASWTIRKRAKRPSKTARETSKNGESSLVKEGGWEVIRDIGIEYGKKIS